MRHCSETRDFAPVLFDWYKFVGSLALAFPSEQCRSTHAGYRYDDRFRYGPPVIAGPARSPDLPVGPFADRAVESYF